MTATSRFSSQVLLARAAFLPSLCTRKELWVDRSSSCTLHLSPGTQQTGLSQHSVPAAGGRPGLLHNIQGTNLQHHQPGECLSLPTAEQLLWASVCQIKGEPVPISQRCSESWSQPALGWSSPRRVQSSRIPPARAAG